MSVQAVLAPVFAQVALTFLLLFWLGAVRRVALNSGAVRPTEIALREPKWPQRALQIGFSFQNQFEMPVLFYAVVAFAMITRQADFLFVVLCWLYVAARLGQAAIHTTSNRVIWRGAVFSIGTAILAVLWIMLAVKIYAAPLA